MSFLRRIFSRNRPSEPTPSVRSLPDLIRVNMSEREAYPSRFVRLQEWSTLLPTVPNWQIPDVVGQVAAIQARVDEHAREGTLDGFVPDLLDRAIAHEMAELRQQVEGAHTKAVFDIQYLYEQAHIAQRAVALELKQCLADYDRADEGYARAYAALTGVALPRTAPEEEAPTPAIASPWDAVEKATRSPEDCSDELLG